MDYFLKVGFVFHLQVKHIWKKIYSAIELLKSFKWVISTLLRNKMDKTRKAVVFFVLLFYHQLNPVQPTPFCLQLQATVAICATIVFTSGINLHVLFSGKCTACLHFIKYEWNQVIYLSFLNFLICLILLMIVDIIDNDNKNDDII